MESSVLIPMLVLVPLLSAALVVWLRGDGGAGVRVMSLASTGATLVIALLVACGFDWSRGEVVQMTSVAEWVSVLGLSFGFGVDAISLWLILLTGFLLFLVVAGSWTAVANREREFFFWLLVLEAAMMGTFVATDVIFFYVCFEFTLVPLYFLIGIFGSTQRHRAARVFFLYTFTGSMLTLAGILYVAWFAAEQTGVWSFSISHLQDIAPQLPSGAQTLVLLALLAGFAVKVPLFPVHTWLPLAHTEAPTAGSVVLAGVLLKLGSYGLLRFALPMTPEAVVALAPWVGAMAVIGIVYAAAVCWVQKDIKRLIAYSSVSHMGFCVLGMFALNQIGAEGSVIYMVNHGLSTGALFLCVGMVYERLHTREMAQMGGLAKVMPVWAFFMVFFCLASVGLPGLNGFVGEFLTLMGAFLATDVLGVGYAVVAGLGMILAAIYILAMVGKVVFGPVRLPGMDEESSAERSSAWPSDLGLRETATLVPLAVACLVLGWYPAFVLDTIEAPVAKLILPARQVLDGSRAGGFEARGPGFDVAPLSANNREESAHEFRLAGIGSTRVDMEDVVVGEGGGR